jgi:rare lipoprotein A
MRGKGLPRTALLTAIGLLLAACGGTAPYYSQGSRNLVPHPSYKIGNPYTVKGITYYPHVDLAYDETGPASWYGEAFQGQYTANGEVYDLNQITAAHRTLPLPSIVEVVNLQNDRAIRVRVNDRGPFADGRIIDVSRRVAQLLGFERSGTTMVRVRILKDESLRAEAAAERGIVSDGVTMVAAAAPAAVTPTVAPAAALATPAAPPVFVAASTAPPPQYAAPATYAAPTQPQPAEYGVPSPVYQGPPAASSAAAHRFLVQSPLYRMEIGPVNTRQEADRALAQMIQSGYRDAHIVMD